MKKIGIVLMLAMVLAGGVITAMPAPSQAQIYVPAPPPLAPVPVAVSAPWVGPNTPWVFYQGDWFLNGILYYFFGNQYGWAPYYSYAPTFIVRPPQWYAPHWNAWYKAHPVYWTNFQRQYPYWREHHTGRHYDQNFYNKYHHGQGAGWHKGFRHNHPPEAVGPGHGHHPPGQPGQ
jgi:hypothetical protein